MRRDMLGWAVRQGPTMPFSESVTNTGCRVVAASSVARAFTSEISPAGAPEIIANSAAFILKPRCGKCRTRGGYRPTQLIVDGLRGLMHGAATAVVATPVSATST